LSTGKGTLHTKIKNVYEEFDIKNAFYKNVLVAIVLRYYVKKIGCCEPKNP
jgi:small basic protein